MKSIDINCDMGELPSAIADGSQEAIMPFLTAINVASGGHAGDEGTMSATIEQARRWKLAIGAHPSYPDRVNFGRHRMQMPVEGITRSVFEQVQWLAEIAARQGVMVRHVKPHGALYNAAAGDAGIARAIAEGVSRWSRDVVLVGLAGSIMLNVFREAGFAAAPEAFADRRYEADGSLRARRFPDALITEPEAAVRQALSIVEDESVTAVDGSRIPVRASTICIHGDTAGARDIAEEVSRALRARGVELRALGIVRD
jgi:UPF0271 protein